jgi:PAS domain-containing protein
LTDEPDLKAMLDLAGEPALVLRRADPSRPAPVIAHVNRAFAELAGLAPEALVGRSLRALRGLLGPREALDELLRAAGQGEPVAGEVELSVAGGGPVALALRGRRLERRPDLYLAWLAEPRGLPGAARPGEPARYLAGLTRECLYELAVEVDCRLRLLWADPRLAELTGYAAEELAGAGRLLRACRRGRPGGAAPAQPAAPGRAAGRARYRLRRKDGTLRLVRDAARPEWAPDGRAVARVVGALADLSAERAEAPLMPLLGARGPARGGGARRLRPPARRPGAGALGLGRENRRPDPAAAGRASARAWPASCQPPPRTSGSTGWRRRPRRPSRSASA